MTTRELINLQCDCANAAKESANDHIKFTANNFPAWAKGHEEELGSIFQHYASIGSHEAVSYLRRNGKL